MGRRRGSKNADYVEARAAILERLLTQVGLAGRYHLSFRELAQAAGVTPSTLRHYFGNRDGVLAATFARIHQGGTPFIAAAATEEHGPAAESLAWFLGSVRAGWEFGVGKAHAFGLTEGLGDAALGQAYLVHMLEPALQAAEARLARHVAQGELGPCDVRQAALSLLAPVILALLHQDALCGAAVRPLDLDAFTAEHLARFLAAHAPGVTPPRVALPPRPSPPPRPPAARPPAAAGRSARRRPASRRA